MVSSTDNNLRKAESAIVPMKGKHNISTSMTNLGVGSGEKAKNAQKTTPFGKKSSYRSPNVSEAQQHETSVDH